MMVLEDVYPARTTFAMYTDLICSSFHYDHVCLPFKPKHIEHGDRTALEVIIASLLMLMTP